MPSEGDDHAASNALWECSYGCWYPQYADLAPASRVIELDQGVVDFLHEDGLVLHEQSDALPQRCKASDVVVEGVDYDPDDLYSDTDSTTSSSSSSHSSSASQSAAAAAAGDDGSSSSRGVPWCERFPCLHASIAAAIAALGGAVAPRLNWSSPSDALWLSSSNSLRCTGPDEVLLLLKGSDRVAHDLEQITHLQANSSNSTHTTHTTPAHQQQHQQDPQSAAASSNATTITNSSSRAQCYPAQLVLRSWCSLQPEWQFRVFVQQHQVVAVSQRDPSQHFPQLTGGQQQQQQQQGSLADIQQRILEFHSRHISSSFRLDSYAMDVYAPPRGRVQLLDFSPISHTTSPLCFTWEELPYQHMKQQQQQHDEQPQQQQQQVLDAGSTQQQHHRAGAGPGQEESSGSSSSSVSRGSAGDTAAAAVVFRVVEHEGMIVPGTRVATGMPFDMLGLPDAVSAVMQAMQQQQLQ